MTSTPAFRLLAPAACRRVRRTLRGVVHVVAMLAGLLSTGILPASVLAGSSEVESTCSRAIVIDRGTLVAEGPIHELRRRRGNPRAALTVHDLGQQALSLLLGSEHVIGVTPTSATPSLVPLASGAKASLVPPGSEASMLHDPDAIVSFVVTLQPGVDGHACLEDLVALLVHAQIRVREAKLEQSSLEDVFMQLTGGTGVA